MSNIALLNQIIVVLDDGQTFYLEAANRSQRSDHRNLFRRIAKTKHAIAEHLREAVVANGETPPADGSFAGSVRKAYAEIRAVLSNDPDGQYVIQLEKFEDRILSSFEYVAAESEDALVRAIASRYMPEIIRDYNEMKTLRRAPEH